MALKTAGFLAAIERGAKYIFQANPGKNALGHFQPYFMQDIFHIILCQRWFSSPTIKHRPI